MIIVCTQASDQETRIIYLPIVVSVMETFIEMCYNNLQVLCQTDTGTHNLQMPVPAGGEPCGCLEM